MTVVLALVGFVVNARAARRAKRRDIRTQNLLDAYPEHRSDEQPPDGFRRAGTSSGARPKPAGSPNRLAPSVVKVASRWACGGRVGSCSRCACP